MDFESGQEGQSLDVKDYFELFSCENGSPMDTIINHKLKLTFVLQYMLRSVFSAIISLDTPSWMNDMNPPLWRRVQRLKEVK